MWLQFPQGHWLSMVVLVCLQACSHVVHVKSFFEKFQFVWVHWVSIIAICTVICDILMTDVRLDAALIYTLNFRMPPKRSRCARRPVRLDEDEEFQPKHARVRM